jgi:monoamine oxidase
MDQSMSAVVGRLEQGLAIRRSWPVSSITYDTGGAVLTGPGGARLGARKVVVTASLGVLQAGRIAFSPPLPADKQGAISRLRMGNAAKVGVTCGGGGGGGGATAGWVSLSGGGGVAMPMPMTVLLPLPPRGPCR